MLILYAILLASAGISTLAEASAIKGHSRPHEDLARSVKLGQIADNVEQQKPAIKSAVAAAAAPQAPILESTKRIYNDESIRRLAAVQQSVEPIRQVEQQAPVPVVPVVAAPVPVVQAKSVVVEQPLEQPIQPVEVKPVEAPVVPVRQVESAPAAVVVVPAVDSLTGRNADIVPAVEQLKPENVKESPAVEPLHIEVPAPDPALVLSEPIDSTTKLLIDLDEHVQKFLPAEEQQAQPKPAKEQTLVAGVDYSPASQAAPVDPTGKSSGPLVPYSSVDEPIVPPLPSLDGVEKASAGAPVAAAVAAAAAAPSVAGSSSPSSSSVSSSSSSSSSSSGSSVAVSPSASRQGGQNQNQQQVITQLLDQLDSLQNRIQDTINQLVSRRRYVMSALLRPMGTYVRRVRTNLERLQNRVNQLQAAAVSVGGGGGQRPGGFVDAAAIETIRRRIDDISKRISDIVNRIRFSLTPTSAPLNSNGRK